MYVDFFLIRYARKEEVINLFHPWDHQEYGYLQIYNIHSIYLTE